MTEDETQEAMDRFRTALSHALIDLKAARVLARVYLGEPHGLNQTIAMVEAALATTKGAKP